MKTARLSEVAEINPPSPIKGRFQADTVLDFCPMASVHSDGRMVIMEQRPYAEVAKGFTPFQANDVLVAKITPCFENNKIALANIKTEFGFGSTEFHVVRCKRDLLDPHYLAHFLRQNKIREDGEKRMTGSAGQKRVPKAFLESLKIPLPLLKEQKNIVAILNQADELRCVRRKSIDRLNDLSQAIFYEMFSKEIFQGDHIPLEAFVKEFRYGTSEKSQQDGYPTLRIPNIVGGNIDISDLKYVPVSEQDYKRLKLEDGDVLFVRTNGNPDYVGRCAVFDRKSLSDKNNDNWIYASYLIRARLDLSKMNPSFLQNFLSMPAGRKALRDRSKTSAGQYNINTEGLGTIPIPVCDIEKQHEYAKRVEDINNLKKVYMKHIEEISHLFSSLQQRVFSERL